MRSLTSHVRRPSPALVVSIIALVVAMSGVGVAATIGNDKVVYACVNQSDLADGVAALAVNELGVPIVDAPDKCGAATQNDYPDALALNVPGPQGAAGQQGPQGPQGLIGVGGPGGPQGPAGQPAPATPKVSPVEAQRLAGSLRKTQDKFDQSDDKIKDALKKLELAKSRGASQQELEKMMQAINAMIAALLSSQQMQQDVLGSISSGVSLGEAQQKFKEAEKLKDGVGDAARKLDQADAAKEQQRALDEMIKKLVAMMQKMQEAQAEQMKALVRL